MIFVIVLFLLMLFFPKDTIHGAASGLLLWYQSLLPALLPFMILSNLLVATHAASFITQITKPLIQRLFRVTEPACFAVIIGFLCGYPMGAKTVGDLLRANQISKNEAEYLLSFCNNSSPMFIIGFLVLQHLKEESLALGTLCILFLSPILCSFLFRKFHHDIHPIAYNETVHHFCFRFEYFDSCMMNAFESITKIGGYMMFFSIFLAIFSRFSILHPFLPLFEITTGIPLLLQMNIPFSFAYPLVLALTSFGGFCAVAQTNSMLHGTGLRIVPYIIQKLITAMVTSLLAFLYITFIHQ